jgi:hypothetical protein
LNSADTRAYYLLVIKASFWIDQQYDVDDNFRSKKMVHTPRIIDKRILSQTCLRKLVIFLLFGFVTYFLYSQPLPQEMLRIQTMIPSQDPMSQQRHLQLQHQNQTQDHRTSLEPLLFWHGGKLLISGLTLGTALTDPDLSQADRVLVAGTGALLAIPAIGVLRNTVTRNTTAIRNWRLVGFVVDLGLSATLISLGVRQAIDPNPSNSWNAVASISIGGLGILLSGLNLLPLRMETVRSIELSN